MFHFGLKEQQAKAVTEGWKQLGVTSIGNVSGQELSKLVA